MNARTLSALALAAGVAAAAHAQIGVADFRWQASLDGGASWHGDWLDVPEGTPSARVRALVSWVPEPGVGYAYAVSRFDAVVEAVGGGLADTASDFLRPPPLHLAFTQTITAVRFGSVLKIDDARDTLPPGEGTRGIQPGQLTEVPGDTPYNTANPISIFEFVLWFDGTPGRRELREHFIAPGGGNTTDRVLRIYTSPLGASNMPLTTRHGLTINVLPAPGAAFPLLFGALALRRARRGRRAVGL